MFVGAAYRSTRTGEFQQNKILLGMINTNLSMEVEYMFNERVNINEEIKEIVNIILNAVPALEIYLFGSFAKGNDNDDSDYDFYVVIPDGLQPIEETWKINEKIAGRKSRGVDMIVGTLSKFNKYKNVYSIEKEVVKTGVKLYG
jgi:predicted nucleotidyltransferase